MTLKIGSNENNGHSPDAPLLDLSKFAYNHSSIPVLNHGDKVLIKRGTTMQCNNVKLYTNNFGLKKCDFVYVGAYGSGDDPILTNHKELSRTRLVKYVDNIYYVDLSTDGTNSNIGFIYDPKQDEIYGNRVFEMGKLENYMDFYVEDNKLYIYSKELESIPENMCLALGNNIMTCDANTIYENLHFTLGGIHGLATTKDANFNIIVKNCMFSKIGGSQLSGTTRYGNGFEIYGDGYDIQVQNCIFEDIYDTGVTFQGENCTFKNCSFNHNVFRRCGQACENWCDNKTAGEGYINCTFNDNLCLLSGHGFGGKNRNNGYDFMLTNANCINTDITVKNNIFFKAKDGCYSIVKGTNVKCSKNKIYLYDEQVINNYIEKTMKQYKEYIEETKQDASSKFIVLDCKNKNGALEEVMLSADLFMSNINHMYSNANCNNNDFEQNNSINILEIEGSYLENIKSNTLLVIDDLVIVNLKAKAKTEIPAYTTYAFNKSLYGFTLEQQYVDENNYVNLANGMLYFQSKVVVPAGSDINVYGIVKLKK